MAKLENQKLKLFHLADILKNETDENHAISMAEIIEKLADKGISAERKSLYNDISLLTDYGIIIEKTSDHHYYVAERDFELAELKILVDIIESSQFLTVKKSRALTKKLYRQTSRYGAAELDRQVHTAYAKAPNEKIFYTVDAIHQSVRDDRRIEFSYFRYNEDKKLVEKQENKRYSVSPIALVFDNENYYLVAYNEKEESIRHYRVDRMQKVVVLDERRTSKDVYGEFDISRYENGTYIYTRLYYHLNGKVSQVNTFSDGGKPYFSYKYNTDGELVEQISYDESGHAAYRLTYSYKHRADGSVSEQRVSDADAGLLYTHFVDKNGISKPFFCLNFSNVYIKLNSN